MKFINMNIQDFKKGDVIFIESLYKWLVRIDRVEDDKLYTNGVSCNLEDGKFHKNYPGTLWGGLEGKNLEFRYATPEELEIYLEQERKLGIEIPINELYQIY